MTVEILEILRGRDWDPGRGYSAWLYVRFPPCKNAPTIPQAQRMADLAGDAFIERYGRWPRHIQNIDRSAWWRAGPVEEEGNE